MTNSPKKEKIAVDTAIWLEALLYGGSAEELIKMAITHKVELIMTEPQFDDLAQALSNSLQFSVEAIAQVRRFIEECAEILPGRALQPASGAHELPEILHLARESDASAIATTERSILVQMGDFEGIPIVVVA